MSAELVLQLAEIGVGLELRIGLGDGHQPAEQAGHRGVGLGGGGDRSGAGRGGALGGDRLERLALVGGIALHRLDQVGDEVGAAAKLDGDPAEGFADQRAEPDQPIVDGDAVEQQQDDDADDDPGDHVQ